MKRRRCNASAVLDVRRKSDNMTQNEIWFKLKGHYRLKPTTVVEMKTDVLDQTVRNIHKRLI